MPTAKNDAIFNVISSAGLDVNELFLVDGKIFSSPDGGDAEAGSIFSSVDNLPAQSYEAVVSLLRKLDRPEYASIDDLKARIQRASDWEALYAEINDLLDHYGKRDGGDFLVVEDDYGYMQQKVECSVAGWYRPAMTLAIQTLLQPYADAWEVIVVGETGSNKPFALSIFKDKIREHAV